MKTKICISFLLCFLYSYSLKAQYSQSTTAEFNTNTNINISTFNNELKLTNDVGNGADGDLYVAPGTTAYTDAVKTFITGTNPSGQNALQVNSSAGFNVGDEVLIITMRDNNTDLNTNIAGQYEFKKILSKLATALILTENLINSYTETGKKHQVLKVPNYNTVTIDYGGILTCSDWDENVGGIICFRSKGLVQISALAKIDVSLKGYAGGPSLVSYGYGDRSDGYQGNGIFGVGVKNIANNSNGGGGGKRCSSGVWDGASSGAGGGNGVTGNNGSGDCAIALGGISLGSPFLTKLFLGGGGGSGANGTFYSPFGTSGKGGEGGGIIYFSCDSLKLLGQILSIGEKGGDAVGATYALGGGGGGAGGSIYIISSKNVAVGNDFISASGGLSGAGIQAGTGGLGGVGRIRIDAPSLTGTSTPPVGYNGISYALSGSSTTQSLIKTAAQCWGILTYNKNTSAPGTSVKVDVLNNAYTVLQSTVNSGSNITISNDTIKLRISLLNNFGNQTPIFYDWMILAITPQAIITPTGNTIFCQGYSVILNANTGAGYTYQWLLNGAIISGATSSSYTATQGGSYTVVVGTSGCSATSLPVVVTMYPLPPTPTISQNGNVLSSTASTGNQWYLNGTAIPGATNQTFNVLSNGTYYVIVTSNGCNSDTSNLILFTSVIDVIRGVSINSDGSNPDVNAMLDVKDNSKCILIPRIDFNNRPTNNLTSGLLMYVISNGPQGNNAFYYYDGTEWVKLAIFSK